MKRIASRIVLLVLCAIVFIVSYFPEIPFAEEINNNEKVNKEFNSSNEVNELEEIKKNSEIVENNPTAYEKIDGSDLKGAEVGHDINSRTYLLENGTYLTRCFYESIMYKDESGKMIDIDNTLENRGEEYVNKENSYSLTLPKEGEGITLNNKGYELKLKPLFGQLKNAKVSENSIRYNSVRDGIDIQYTANGSDVKEDIILNKPVDIDLLSYQVEARELDLRVEENVFYASKDGEDIFVITAPFMKDNSNESSQAIKLDFNSEENKLILEADKDWLQDKKRSFPVTIDPKIMLNSSNMDWYLVENGVGVTGYSAGPNVEHIGNPYLYAGFEKGDLTDVVGLTYGMTKSYIKINYDFKKIPKDTIISAKLKAYKYAGHPKSGSKVYCKMVTSDWQGSKKTWNTKPKTANIIANAVDVSGSSRWVEWDISKAVSEWSSGASNYGLVIEPEVQNQAAVCFSGPGNEHGKEAMYFDISWTVPNAVDEEMPISIPKINLRPLTESGNNGLQKLRAVFADGLVRPTAEVNYRLNDLVKDTYAKAEYGRVYPESSKFKGQVNFTIGYTRLLESNWQSDLFKKFNNNEIYNVYAKVKAGDEESKEGKSDSFIVYEFTDQDTLPYVANFYGVSLEQILKDNQPQDYLGFTGNTFFIRNPKKNATKPYRRPDNLSDARKRELIYANLGRGMHSEFDLEPVNVNIGNFYFDSQDASLNSYGEEVILSRSYNSIGAKSYGSFGNGWSFEYNASLTGRSNGDILYTMGDGKQIVFKKKGTSYESPAGYYLNLKKIDNKDKAKVYYTITDADSVIYTFNAYGLLTSITSKSGLITKVNYDSSNKISSIADPNGRTFSITTNTDGCITAIKLPNGGNLKYEYNNGNLVKYTDADGIGYKYNYNANGQMTEWFDGNGERVVKNEYDKEGRISKQTDANGKVTTLTYGADYTKLEDSSGEISLYNYDSQYRTTAVDKADKNNKATYNANNELDSLSEDGLTTKYEYDLRGNLTKKIFADGSFEEITYDNKSNPITIKDRAGFITKKSYDSKGNLLELIRPDGSKNTYTYDKYGQVTSLVDGNNNKTIFNYNGLDSMTTTDANGHKSTVYYDAMGQAINEVDAKGNESKVILSKQGKKLGTWKSGGISEGYAYDKNGNCISYIDPEGNKTSYSYDKLNRLVTSKTANGESLTYEYDNQGNKIAEIDAKGNKTSFEYNSDKKLVASTNALNQRTRYSYREDGLLESIVDSNGNETRYEYDSILKLKTKVIDVSGQISYEYDKLGNLTKTIYQDGSSEETSYDSVGNITSFKEKNGLVTEYEYDKEGNVLSKRDKSGRASSFIYDKTGNVLSEKDALNRTNTYIYDEANRLIQSKDPSGNKTNYELDSIGNIVKTTYSNGSFEEMTYDKNSNLTSKTDANGNTSNYKYNAGAELAASIDANGAVNSYKYDNTGLLVTYTNPVNASNNYEYDALSRVIKKTDAKGNVTSISYDESGNISSIEYSNGAKVDYTYNKLGFLVKEVLSNGLVTEYERDVFGNESRVWNNEGANKKKEYDLSGNLIKEIDEEGRSKVYKYDLHNNLLELKDFNGDILKYEYDLADRLVLKVDKDGRKTKYTYDALDNVIEEVDNEGRKKLYTYDDLSRLTSEVNALKEETSYEYDNVGNLTSKKDPLGNETSYKYSNVNEVIEITDPRGGVSKNEYSLNGNLIKTTSPEGSITEYSYDLLDNLMEEKNPLGFVTKYESDEFGNLLKEVSPRGGVTSYTYDSSGFLTSKKGPEGGLISYENSLDGKLKTETKENGLKLSYEYDKLGRIKSMQDSMGLKKTLTYDEKGNINSQTDQDGKVTKFSYNKQSKLVKMTNANGATTNYSYDKRGNLSKIISPSGAETNYSYDKLDRVNKVEKSLLASVSYKYDSNNNILESKQGEKVTKNTYDANGNLTAVTNPLGFTSKISYDKDNREVKRSNFSGKVTENKLDANGNILESINPNGAKNSYTYDADGNVISLKDPVGNEVKYQYDLAGRLKKSQSQLGKITKYSYDRAGNLTSSIDANGKKTKYEYDGHRNLIRIESPDKFIEKFEYDLSSNLKKAIKPDGQVIAYNYDKLDQLLSKDFSDDSKEVKYSYDTSGNKVGMEDSSGNSSYRYDKLGRVTSAINGAGYELKYSYDEYGRVKQIQYPDGKIVEYEYDLLDNLVKVKSSGSSKEEADYTYDKDGNVIRCQRSSGIVTEYSYDDLGQLVSLVNKEKGTVLSSFSYQYDLNQRIIEETAYQKEASGEEKKSLKKFSYDGDGQLEEYVEESAGKKTTTKYSYSETGNRLAVTKGDDKAMTVSEYNDKGQLIKEVSKDGTSTFKYDENGNLIEKKLGSKVTSYAYDIENRLKVVKEGGSVLMAASYDGDGNRVFALERKIVDVSNTKLKEGPSHSQEVARVESINTEEDSKGEILVDEDKTNKDNKEDIADNNNTVGEDGKKNVFWYGFCQGIANFFGGISRAIAVTCSSLLSKVWGDLNSDSSNIYSGNFSDKDIDALKNTGLSDEEIETIVSGTVSSDEKRSLESETITGTLIPENSKGKGIEYDISFYVNDINSANTQVLASFGKEGAKKNSYTYGNERLSDTDYRKSSSSDYIYDGRGSVVQTSIDGKVDLSLSYDPFGKIESGVDENFVGFAYNGEESNEATGLQYLRARYYDPDTATFTSIDSYLGNIFDPKSQNRYTYASNDPVNNIDPSGHASLNVRGASSYYQSTGLNELRDYMSAAALWSGQVNAYNSFNNSVMKAYNTSFFNYKSISGISQETENKLVNNGIQRTFAVSKNYGCNYGFIPYAAANKFAYVVKEGRKQANQNISSIKSYKKQQYNEYQAYQAYLRELERARARQIQREAELAEADKKKKKDGMSDIISLFGSLGFSRETVIKAFSKSNKTSRNNVSYRPKNNAFNSIYSSLYLKHKVNTQSKVKTWSGGPGYNVDKKNLSANAYAGGMGASYRNGKMGANASVYAGYASAKADSELIGFDSKKGVGLRAAAHGEAEVALVKGMGAFSYGDGNSRFTATAEGSLLSAWANGDIRFGANKNGVFEAYADGDVGAALAKGDISIEFYYYGLKHKITFNGYAGGAGANGEIGYFEENGVLKWRMGGGVFAGLGGGIVDTVSFPF